MKLQPPKSIHGVNSNDNVSTPHALSDLIVEHFKPSGLILEPCAGPLNNRPFVDSLDSYNKRNGDFNAIFHGDIITGEDFLGAEGRAGYWDEYLLEGKKFDWILCNFAWSKIRICTERSFQLCDNLISLATLNHLVGLKARNRLLRQYNFGIEEIVLLDTPKKDFPNSGFQLSCVHYKKNKKDNLVKWTNLQKTN